MSGGLSLRTHADIASFEAAASGLLAVQEAEHNVVLGLLERHRSGDEGPIELMTIERDGEVVAVAYRTPPHRLGVSPGAPVDAAGLLVRQLRETDAGLSAIVAGPAFARSFAEAWRAATGSTVTGGMDQRIQACRRVADRGRGPGTMRRAGHADRDLVEAWAAAFSAEATPGMPFDARTFAEARLGGHPDLGLVLWVDGAEAVSMAGWTGPTPNGIRVNAVYTPPERRGRGYATSCVAALTEQLLDQRSVVFLFTDLANPTSNGIYARIGYEPVCDVRLVSFAGGGDGGRV